MGLRFIDSLIPNKFREDYGTKLLAKGTLFAISIIAFLQFWVGIALLTLNKNVDIFLVNLIFSLSATALIYSMRFFRTIEAYINAILTCAYVAVFFVIVYEGGIYSHVVFWLGVLLAASIFFTRLRHTIFWFIVVAIFVTMIFVIPSLGNGSHPIEYTFSHKIINVISYFVLVLTIAFIYASITIKKKKYLGRIIDMLERVNNERTELLSFISHDLRSPNAKISGLVELLENTNLTEEQKEIVKFIKGTNKQSSHLINDILAPYSTAMDIPVQQVEIGCILKGLVMGYTPIAAKKDIKIEYQLNMVTAVNTCKSHVQRILDNLLSNAVKYSRPGANININLSQEHGQILIAIKDEGPGFIKEEVDELFVKPGKRSAQPTGNEDSHGLGLSIVKRLSEEIEARVELKHTSPEGSVFEVAIPA